ncbi:MAG TPA: HAMP domain-containing sensor histidine kinase [Ignavibacteria bacterium]|nr:HAMP domain-containing sensor histidine kinase [Ignavibacteria bacterium]
MFNFIPQHTIDFEQLWALISSRNRWFISIRYVVAGAVAVFALVMQYVFKIGFEQEQIWAMAIISASLFFLNILYGYIDAKGFIKNEVSKFNPLHFAFNQIVLDLLAIALLSYYSGGIESPFYFFFVFHMIIGSMILPGTVVYTLSGVSVLYIGVVSVLELYGIIEHHGFGNLLTAPLYNNIQYIIVFVTAYGIMIFVSVFLANNITSAHYRRSQELKMTLDKLSQAEKMKMKYTMGVVHEIKTPIVAVQSNIDIILQGYAGEIPKSAKDRISRARARSEEAIHIINDVLNISKLKLLENVNKDDVDLAEMITGMYKKRGVQARTSGVELKLTDRRNEPKPVKVDRGLFELALSNIIGNAIKYNTHNGIVESIIEERDGDTFITIADNGIGIPDEDKNKMFKEFYRSTNAKQKGVEGTGLGLSVVKEIIEHHGGDIWFKSPSRLQSEGRRGTEFTILISCDDC